MTAAWARLFRVFCLLSLMVAVSACAVSRPFEASEERVAAAAYVPKGPPKLTLFTVVNNSSGSGGHSALMVSGSQQVIFDPAGSFNHYDIPKRGDVLYGVTPGWIAAYKSAHARSTYHVVTQEIEVSPQEAELALQLVRNNGAVPAAFCANATSSILRQIPGFEGIKTTFYPVNLMEQVAQRPDVVTEKYYEDDDGHITDGIVGATD